MGKKHWRSNFRLINWFFKWRFTFSARGGGFLFLGVFAFINFSFFMYLCIERLNRVSAYKRVVWKWVIDSLFFSFSFVCFLRLWSDDDSLFAHTHSCPGYNGHSLTKLKLHSIITILSRSMWLIRVGLIWRSVIVLSGITHAWLSNEA